MTYKFHHRSFRSLIRAVLFIAALAATAVGCMWVETADSVRFNGFQNYREMGRLPPLPTPADATNTLRAAWGDEQSASDNYTLSDKQSRAIDELWESAMTFEKEGNLAGEQTRLREYLQRTTISRNAWLNPDDRERRRNIATDKLDALTALNQDSSRSHVQAYLAAR